MDPLSAIASVIAISQALGISIRALRSLANVSAEFSDLVHELSTLQASMVQLSALVNMMADPHLCLPGELISRIGIIHCELSQIVDAIEDVTARLLRTSTNSAGHNHHVSLNKKREPNVSAISWYQERSKVTKLRDRAKRCREELSVCLGLLGFAEQ
jgi:hypothetical protein